MRKSGYLNYIRTIPALALIICLIFIILLFFSLIYFLKPNILKNGYNIHEMTEWCLNNNITARFNECSINSDCPMGICYKGICIYYEGVPYCLKDCHCSSHGECWFTKCRCFDGWQGIHCEERICPENITIYCESNNDCKYGATITGECYYNKCFCDPNYIGNTCNKQRKDLSYCEDLTHPCLNGGECHVNDHGYGECYCPYGTSGSRCEIIVP